MKREEGKEEKRKTNRTIGRDEHQIEIKISSLSTRHLTGCHEHCFNFRI